MSGDDKQDRTKARETASRPTGESEAASADPEELARNMVRLLEESGRAVSAYLKPREKGETPLLPFDEFARVAKTMGAVAENWLSDPQRAVKAQSELFGGYMDVWSRSMRRFWGGPEANEGEGESKGEAPASTPPAPGDKRFADPEWSDNQFFDLIKETYLVTSQWAERMARDAEDLDDHTRHKAEFYVKQIANALAPSNFVLTNPALLRETLSQNGENLVRGMRMLAEDIERGEGELRIRQSDPEAFKVGENLALTPGKVIYQNDLMQLIQYNPTTEKVLKRPLLIVPPWINKFYILDLTPQKSFIKWCVDQGLTVFVISWANPDRRLAQKSFESYMLEGIVEAVKVVEKVAKCDRINTIGYCVGGTLLATALAYLTARGDKRIASATLFTTQVDFTHAGDLKVFVDEEQIAAIERQMQERGFLEGKKMAGAFNLLRSNDLIWPYVVNNYMKGQAPFPFDLLFWNSDATRMPAANHSFYLRKCYLENALTKGEMEIGGERLDLGAVTVPIYNLAAREDHIAPARSVFLGCRFFGGPVRYVMAGSGHIAGVINPPAKNKYQYWTGEAPAGEFEEWVERAEEHPGSWWPDWLSWITSLDEETVKARKPGGGKYKPIEDAPGSYVKVRA